MDLHVWLQGERQHLLNRAYCASKWIDLEKKPSNDKRLDLKLESGRVESATD